MREVAVEEWWTLLPSRRHDGALRRWRRVAAQAGEGRG
jgi:hypothetical protein